MHSAILVTRRARYTLQVNLISSCIFFEGSLETISVCLLFFSQPLASVLVNCTIHTSPASAETDFTQRTNKEQFSALIEQVLEIG